MTDEMLAEIEALAAKAAPMDDTGHSQACGCVECSAVWRRGRDAYEARTALPAHMPALVAALREARAILTDACCYLERDAGVSHEAGRLVERIDAALRGES